MTTTSDARALAAAFEQANEELVAHLEDLPDGHWHLECPGEGWTVGVTAHHVGVAYRFHRDMLAGIAAGRPLPPMSWSKLDQINTRHAEESAACTREETIGMLRREADAVAAILRGLRHEQLRSTGSFFVELPELSVADWVELVLVGHVHMHLSGIRSASGAGGRA